MLILVVKFCCGFLVIAMPRMSYCFEANFIISLWYKKPLAQSAVGGGEKELGWWCEEWRNDTVE